MNELDLSDLLPDAAATPEPSPEPTATPEPSPEPTATPEPSPEPTATVAPGTDIGDPSGGDPTGPIDAFVEPDTLSLLLELGWTPFLLLTVFLGGAAAYMAGKATAQTWRPVWTLVFYMVLLAAAVRFLHYAVGPPLMANMGTEAVVRVAVEDGEVVRRGAERLPELHADLFSGLHYLRELVVLMVIALLGFRLTRARQMVSQYGWLYTRRGAFNWTRRPDSQQAE